MRRLSKRDTSRFDSGLLGKRLDLGPGPVYYGCAVNPVNVLKGASRMMRNGRILLICWAALVSSGSTLGADLFPTEVRRQAFLKALG